MSLILITWGFFTSFFIWSLVRQKRLLKYFQQHEYHGTRFIRWLFVENKSFDYKLTLQLICLSLLALLLKELFIEGRSSQVIESLWTILAPLTVLYRSYLEKDEHKGKKNLVFTSRAKRIFLGSAFVNVIFLLLFPPHLGIGYAMLFIQLQPVFLVISNALLWLFESQIQSKLIQQAQNKLDQIDMVTIGITGSFGKTSLKHILGHMLSLLDRAYMTPGSVNTVMGVTRAIREGLSEQTKIFIVEMGAYARGSIARLCRLAPPDIAVVTSIGPAHYERFKSLEEVALAKSELPAAALSRNGRCYLGSSVGQYEPFKELAKSYHNHERGENPISLDPLAQRIVRRKEYHTLDGLVIECLLDGREMTIKVPIFGKHQVENILLALLVVIDMGYSLDDAVTSLQSLQQIKHRLEVKQMTSGLTWIDDGFNSNPAGFCSAVEFMTQMRDLKYEKALALQNADSSAGSSVQKGKRYLITPGMVELGSEHDRLHEQVGMIAVEHVDVLLAVCPERIGALIDVFEKKGKTVHRFASFQSACHFFLNRQHAEDVVLIENDLPDLYESPPSF